MEDDERPEGWTEDRPPTEEELEHSRQVHPSYVHPLPPEGSVGGPAVIMGLGGMFGGPPPEVVERQNMQIDLYRHEMYRVFETLDGEQLLALVRILNRCGQEPDGIMFANHFEGIAQGILSVKFGHCLACGKNHDKEASELCDPS